ncbi:alpha/beta-hydrolase [Rhizophagus clarus]|uniref:Alpha/beta-hydrolase n=1 Tax=Rhizophagus clarus TaxID=94130 RepID=A0A8H3QTY3_9GLOM|nr:alpha/beta-hydrolase [Rhizophagus clarus]
MANTSSSATITAAAVNFKATTRQPHISSTTIVESGYCEAGKSFGAGSYFNSTHTIKIYYEIHGNGPNKLLFIMGLNNTSESWDHQIHYFGNHPDYQICVFDNRGVGYSDAPAGFYSTSQMAHDVIDLCEYIGWTKNIHLIGVSMGGMTLPPLLCVTTLSRLLFIRNPLDKIDIVVKLLFPNEWLRAPAPPGSSHATNEEHILETFRQRIAKRGIQPVNGAIGQMAACIRHYCSPSRLHRIKCYISQILVITGTLDNLVNPANSYYLAKQLNAEFECWEGSGHALPNEQAERYNNLLDFHFRKSGLINIDG